MSQGPGRNRVTPMGDIVAIPLRGAWTGNRGILHRGREIVRFHASDLWITCALEFRGRRSQQWRAGRFTWLYFHDEAVSFAAGHRPCGECRREAYSLFKDLIGGRTAGEINRRLHAERIVRGTHRRRLHPMPWDELPDGTFVKLQDTTAVVRGDEVVEWTFSGYGTRQPRGQGMAAVITPPSIVDVLRKGYPVQIGVS
ncbi:hypothetical protein [Actinocrispum sp. NPDC049592]|uniref:hypothetical protein n=1 Tax=Actinocrispum sp. NPDC049592 TaxID=3154835 RepID=UPI0034415D1A